MLVFTRKIGEEIVIGGAVRVTVVGLGRGRVKIGIEAPPEVVVDRAEVAQQRLSSPCGPVTPRGEFQRPVPRRGQPVLTS